jgi:hypothetical protein
MALASILITSAVAVPGARTEARSIKLDNGKGSVEVIDTTLSSRSESQKSTYDPPVQHQLQRLRFL